MPENSLKNFFSRIMLMALIGAAAGFSYSLLLPKYYQVTAKIVIVPSGSSSTAGANLFVEAGNAAEMITSPSFQKAYFSDFSGSFSEARQIGNSSTMAVSFLALQNDITATEDLLVKIPENIQVYAKEIYGGFPFKYLLISDPEVSARPAKPDIYKNIEWGFFAGAIIYFLYWLFSDFIYPEKREFQPSGKIASPDMKEKKKETFQQAIGFPKPTAKEKPKPAGKKIIQPISAMPAAPSAPAAPDNLPVSEEVSPAPSDFSEPSDEEVKERLNRLMRGEL